MFVINPSAVIADNFSGNFQAQFLQLVVIVDDDDFWLFVTKLMKYITQKQNHLNQSHLVWLGLASDWEALKIICLEPTW